MIRHIETYNFSRKGIPHPAARGWKLEKMLDSSEATKNFLYKRYVEEQKCASEIGAEVGLSDKAICILLKRYGIPRRPPHRFKEGNQEWKKRKR